MNFLDTLENLVNQTAFMSLTVGNYIMIVVACVFLYLAIKKGYEPKESFRLTYPFFCLYMLLLIQYMYRMTSHQRGCFRPQTALS